MNCTNEFKKVPAIFELYGALDIMNIQEKEVRVMRNLRFLHVADTHLGMEFKSQSSKDAHFYETLLDATYRAFDRVIGHAIEQKVDFVVFSGDIYHKAGDNLHAQAYFSAKALELKQASIEVYVVGGNHDPLNNRRLAQPDNVHLLSSERVERIFIPAKDESPSYTIYGRSYAKPDENDNFALAYRREKDDVNAIGLLHTNVGTRGQGEKYARASLNDLINADMDYWALGHIHKEEILNDTRPTIVYPGSTQALHINEEGRHGCRLVEMDQGAVKKLEWLPTGVIGFSTFTATIDEAESFLDLSHVVFQQVSAYIDELDLSAKETGINKFLLRFCLKGARRFSEPIDTSQLISNLSEIMNGAYPKKVLIDEKLIDETTVDPRSSMMTETNLFLRMILDEGLDELDADAILTDSLAKAPKDLKDSIREELEAEMETLFEEAKMLLFTELREGHK